jgi:hypothetical protein
MRLVCLTALLSACSAYSGRGNTQLTREALQNDPVRKLATWQASLDLPLHKRVCSPSRELLEYIRRDGQLQGFNDQPVPANAPEIENELRDILAELPVVIQRALDGRLAAVLVIRGLEGTGYTESIDNARGEPAAGFVVINADAARSANEWASWKEASPYALKDLSVVARIETPEHDNRKNMLRYILLHELGHVLAVGRDFNPAWSATPSAESVSGEFVRLTWTAREEHYVSLFDVDFPERTAIRYYAGPNRLLPETQAALVLRRLGQTNFLTPYGATSPHDDFAESFVTYVHSVLDKRPWSIEVRRGAEVIERLELGWGTARCRSNELFLAKLLGDANEP